VEEDGCRHADHVQRVLPQLLLGDVGEGGLCDVAEDGSDQGARDLQRWGFLLV